MARKPAEPLTDAQRELVAANRALAPFALNRLLRSTPAAERHADELRSEAELTLVRCARCWRPERAAFSTYAVWAMHREMRRALAKIMARPMQTLEHEPPARADRIDPDAWGDVLETVATFRPRHRLAFWLRWQAGLDFSEIGEALGCTKQRAFQICRWVAIKLKAILGGRDGEGEAAA